MTLELPAEDLQRGLAAAYARGFKHGTMLALAVAVGSFCLGYSSILEPPRRPARALSNVELVATDLASRLRR
jgi:hypothetical protein